NYNLCDHQMTSQSAKQPMSNDLKDLESNLLSRLQTIRTLEELETFRIEALGKQGTITSLMKSLGSLDPDERKEKGALYNTLRESVSSALEARKEALEEAALLAKLSSEKMDVTLPSRPSPSGS